MPRPIVFLGPSLPRAEARRLVDADFRPPVRMGDVYSVLRTDLPAIVVIDGVFHGEPAVWHRELLDAITEGIPVYGAASMGALRAAELHTLGMRGHGTVFEWYRDGALDTDDAVALLHGPEEAGYVALSEPLVNIRATLAAAVEADALSAHAAAKALRLATKRHFATRAFETLCEDALAAHWEEDDIAQLRSALRTHRCNVKRDDARGVLERCAREIAAGGPRIAGALEAPSHHWHLGRVLRAPIAEGNGQAALEACEDRAVRRDRAAAERFALEWTRPRAVNAAAFAADVSDELLVANGLLRSRHTVLRRQQSLLDGLRERGAAEFGLTPVAHADALAAFVLAWAREQGVATPPVSDAAVVDWLIAQGPEAFGVTWNADVAVLEQLQMDGVRTGGRGVA